MIDLEIFLSDSERRIVLDEAERRQNYNQERNIKGRNGGAEKGEMALLHHKLGCAGEMAVAKYLGLKKFLFSELTPKKGSCDLPFNIDVKTRRRSWHNLIVQKDDIMSKNFWLVTIEDKHINLEGWIYGHEAFKDEYVNDPVGGRPAYFVPKRRLKTPESFYQHFKPLDSDSM